MNKSKKIIKVVTGIFLTILLLIGGGIYMSHKIATERNDRLIQHGFKLLEEQIATYIIENYSGVSKIEFSPIFVDGGDGFTIFTSNVVPLIYDNHGNKVVLGNSGPGDAGFDFGTSADLRLSLGNQHVEIIEILNEQKDYVDVSKYEHLPEFAKLKTDEYIDENIHSLNQTSYLRNVVKDKGGSPKVEVIYNLEIREGSYWEWP